MVTFEGREGPETEDGTQRGACSHITGNALFFKLGSGTWAVIIVFAVSFVGLNSS